MIKSYNFLNSWSLP